MTPPAAQPDALSRLPHAPPFRFITEIVRAGSPGVEGAGERSEAVWRVRGDEPFFAWHFPGRPLLPGVLLSESLAQLSGVAWAQPAGTHVHLARIDVKILAPVRPPAEVRLFAGLSRSMGPAAMFEVEARVGDARVATGWITLSTAGDGEAA